MSAKFIQYCDVLPGKMEEFRKFAAKSYLPGLNETGLLKLVGVWSVAAGEGPYCIMEGVAESVKAINQLLALDEFKKLNHLMHFLTTNYATKILAPTGKVESYLPAEPHCRFNHHYNLISQRRQEYDRFKAEEQLPALREMGIQVIGSWYVALGPGPQIVVEGSCPDTESILKAIGSDRYRKVTNKLLTMATDFGSKILVPMGLL